MRSRCAGWQRALQRGSLRAGNQRRNVAAATAALAAVAAEHELVVTHGNGPQVGLHALQPSVAGRWRATGTSGVGSWHHRSPGGSSRSNRSGCSWTPGRSSSAPAAAACRSSRTPMGSWTGSRRLSTRTWPPRAGARARCRRPVAAHRRRCHRAVHGIARRRSLREATPAELRALGLPPGPMGPKAAAAAPSWRAVGCSLPRSAPCRAHRPRSPGRRHAGPPGHPCVTDPLSSVWVELIRAATAAQPRRCSPGAKAIRSPDPPAGHDKRATSGDPSRRERYRPSSRAITFSSGATAGCRTLPRRSSLIRAGALSCRSEPSPSTASRESRG